jgi:hypothetical protein
LDVTIALGEDHGILQLSETKGQVEGTYSGILGRDKPVKGTYKDQKLFLSFSGDWPTDGTPAQVTLDASFTFIYVSSHRHDPPTDRAYRFHRFSNSGV